MLDAGSPGLYDKTRRESPPLTRSISVIGQSALDLLMEAENHFIKDAFGETVP